MTIPGGKPVTALPGLTPRSPATMLGPVLVTVEPPRTPKLAAVPSDWANAGEEPKRNAANPTLAKSLEYLRFILSSLLRLLIAEKPGAPSSGKVRGSAHLRHYSAFSPRP